MAASYADWIDSFHERAAIIEFDAATPRAIAEREASAETANQIIATLDLDETWLGIADNWRQSGLPATWIIGVLVLQVTSPKADWPIRRWPMLQQAIADFCSEWAGEAMKLGWTERELFGCHKSAPWHHLAGQGLALRLGEYTSLESIDQTGAVFRAGPKQAKQSYRRGQNAPLHPSEQSFVWCLEDQH